MDEKAFWLEVRRGLLLVVRAIEYRWKLPRGSEFTIGAAPQSEVPQMSHEPPHGAPARSSHERVG